MSNVCRITTSHFRFFLRDVCSSECDIATGMLYVCLSVCNVELSYCCHKGWFTRIISVWSRRFSDSKICSLAQEEQLPNFAWKIGRVAVFTRKPAISLKGATYWSLIWSCIRAIDLLKSTTLDDLDRPLRALIQNTCVFGAHHEILNCCSIPGPSATARLSCLV